MYIPALQKVHWAAAKPEYWPEMHSLHVADADAPWPDE
jgi:hypothetical protein